MSRTLNSYVIGEHVGSVWGLGRMLRWTPTVAANKLRPDEDQRDLLKSVGLYKIQGEAVAAVIGGIYQHFVRSTMPLHKHFLMPKQGGSVAHRVFHTRLLPNALLPGQTQGLPDEFHADAEALCKQMGGPDGKLLFRTPSDPFKHKAIAN